MCLIIGILMNGLRWMQPAFHEERHSSQASRHGSVKRRRSLRPLEHVRLAYYCAQSDVALASFLPCEITRDMMAGGGDEYPQGDDW